MELKEIKQKIRDNVKIERVNPPITGGQSCGIIYPKYRLYSEDLDLTIETGYHRSLLKNQDLLLALFEVTLDDLIK